MIDECVFILYSIGVPWFPVLVLSVADSPCLLRWRFCILYFTCCVTIAALFCLLKISSSLVTCVWTRLSLRLPRFTPLWTPAMLAAVTTGEVTLLDLTGSHPPTFLSSSPIPVASSNALCATWSTDGTYLYVAWSHGAIFRYAKSGKSWGVVWKTEEASGPPVALATRDKDTILIAYSSKVVAADLIKKRPTVELLKVSGPHPFEKSATAEPFYISSRALNLWCHLRF